MGSNRVELRYYKTPIGISKLMLMGTSGGSLVLSLFTRPTEYQKLIVDSTWKEDGLFYHSLTLLIFTSLSLLLFTIFTKYCAQSSMRISELVLYTVGFLGFLVFGGGVLESTLSIFSRVGKCCEEYHRESNESCTLPGVIMDSYHSLALSKQFKKLNFDHEYGEYDSFKMDKSHEVMYKTQLISDSLKISPFQIIQFPPSAQCDKDLSKNAWHCTICINSLIQPFFEMKGAAGAVGLIAALASFIVIYVASKEFRDKKGTRPVTAYE